MLKFNKFVKVCQLIERFIFANYINSNKFKRKKNMVLHQSKANQLAVVSARSLNDFVKIE